MVNLSLFLIQNRKKKEQEIAVQMEAKNKAKIEAKARSKTASLKSITGTGTGQNAPTAAAPTVVGLAPWTSDSLRSVKSIKSQEITEGNNRALSNEQKGKMEKGSENIYNVPPPEAIARQKNRNQELSKQVVTPSIRQKNLEVGRKVKSLTEEDIRRGYISTNGVDRLPSEDITSLVSEVINNTNILSKKPSNKDFGYLTIGNNKENPYMELAAANLAGKNLKGNRRKSLNNGGEKGNAGE